MPWPVWGGFRHADDAHVFVAVASHHQQNEPHGKDSTKPQDYVRMTGSSGPSCGCSAKICMALCGDMMSTVRRRRGAGGGGWQDNGHADAQDWSGLGDLNMAIWAYQETGLAGLDAR